MPTAGSFSSRPLCPWWRQGAWLSSAVSSAVNPRWIRRRSWQHSWRVRDHPGVKSRDLSVLPEAPISHPYNPGLATASQLPPPKKKHTNLEIIKLANSESPQGARHSAFTWFISVLETRNKTNAASLHHIHWVTWHGVPSFVGLDGGHLGLRKWEMNLWRLRSLN